MRQRRFLARLRQRAAPAALAQSLSVTPDGRTILAALRHLTMLLGNPRPNEMLKLLNLLDDEKQ
jgi:hypothetical protein